MLGSVREVLGEVWVSVLGCGGEVGEDNRRGLGCVGEVWGSSVGEV